MFSSFTPFIYNVTVCVCVGGLFGFDWRYLFPIAPVSIHLFSLDYRAIDMHVLRSNQFKIKINSNICVLFYVSVRVVNWNILAFEISWTPTQDQFVIAAVPKVIAHGD